MTGILEQMPTGRHHQDRPVFQALLRRHCLLLFMMLVVTAGSRAMAIPPYIGSPVIDPVQPRHCRVAWTGDPRTEALLSWTTGIPGLVNRVHFDTESRADGTGDYRWTSPGARTGPYTLHASEKRTLAPAYYHHVLLDSLPGGQMIWFVMETDGRFSREYHFTTAPPDDQPFSFLFGGDSRSGHAARQRVNRLIARLAREHDDLLAFVHGGDYIADGEYWKQWSLWLSHHGQTVTSDGRMLPIIPARGNHDPGPLFNDIFDAPGVDGLNYYALHLGPQVVLLTLNTEISAGGDQALWLAQELAHARPRSRWVMTQYHRAIYPAYKEPARSKVHWVPLFEKYLVDLCLEADGHTMKRTVPVLGDVPHPQGVTYVGEGGLGVPPRTPRAGRWYLEAPGMVSTGHHVIMVHVNTEQLRIRFIRLPDLPNGRLQIADTHVLSPRS